VCVVVDAAADIPAFADYKSGPKAAAAAAAPQQKAAPTAAAPPPSPSPPPPAAVHATPPPHPIPSNLLAGPAALRLLHENPHINALTIKGTGPKGRVLKGDVLAAIAAAPPPPSSSQPHVAAAPAKAKAANANAGAGKAAGAAVAQVRRAALAARAYLQHVAAVGSVTRVPLCYICHIVAFCSIL